MRNWKNTTQPNLEHGSPETVTNVEQEHKVEQEHTVLLGDDPQEVNDITDYEERKAKEQEQKRIKQEMEELIQSRMSEYTNAMTNTFAEIMYGAEPKKGTGDK